MVNTSNSIEYKKQILQELQELYNNSLIHEERVNLESVLGQFNIKVQKNENNTFSFYNQNTNEQLLIGLANDYCPKQEECNKNEILEQSLKNSKSGSNTYVALKNPNNILEAYIIVCDGLGYISEIRQLENENEYSIEKANDGFIYKIFNNKERLTQKYTISKDSLNIEIYKSNKNGSMRQYKYITYSIDGLGKDICLDISGNNIKLKDGYTLILDNPKTFSVLGFINSDIINIIKEARLNNIPINDFDNLGENKKKL